MQVEYPQLGGNHTQDKEESPALPNLLSPTKATALVEAQVELCMTLGHFLRRYISSTRLSNF